MPEAVSLRVTEETPDPATGAGMQEQPSTGNVTRVSVDPSQTPETTPPEQKPGERPAWLPEKFKSPEDLAKAYAELEQKQSGQKPAQTPTTPETPKVDAVTPEAAQKAGVNLDALYTEYGQNGKLSDTSYADLAAKGFDKATVDAHIEGQKARAEAYTNKLAEVVGGRESLDAILKWAGPNLADAQKAAINEALASGNEALAQMALRGLHSDYVAKVGSDPKVTVNGQATPRTATVQPFGSNDEIVRAMSDRRYKEGDPAYHAQVEARLAVTNLVNARAY